MNGDKKARVAVVGAGQFGRNHCRVIHQSERAELVAVVDIDSARAAESAAPAGARTFTDCRELAGLVDAAVVAVPTVSMSWSKSPSPQTWSRPAG